MGEMSLDDIGPNMAASFVPPTFGRRELERERRALSSQRANLEKKAGALQRQVAALLETRYPNPNPTRAKGKTRIVVWYHAAFLLNIDFVFALLSYMAA